MSPEQARLELVNKCCRFNLFFFAVQSTHADLAFSGKGHKGHGFDHDLLVAQYTTLIAEDVRVAHIPRVSDMTWVAALLHSFDRFFGEDAARKTVEFLELLPAGHFTPEQLDEIRLAIVRHDKPNAEDDSPTLVILKDADRLANVGPIVMVRSGQFKPDIPAIELEYCGTARNPRSTYNEPWSCHDDLIGCQEWERHPKFGVRLETTKKLAAPYFDFMRRWFELTERQFQETGITPWPIPKAHES